MSTYKFDLDFFPVIYGSDPRAEDTQADDLRSAEYDEHFERMRKALDAGDLGRILPGGVTVLQRVLELMVDLPGNVAHDVVALVEAVSRHPDVTIRISAQAIKARWCAEYAEGMTA